VSRVSRVRNNYFQGERLRCIRRGDYKEVIKEENQLETWPDISYKSPKGLRT
jgi:hypothetical protein